MAGRTHLQVLNEASVSTQMAAALAIFSNQDPTTGGFGQILRGMTPGFVSRTGLVSGATHIEELPGRIHAVLDFAGTTEQLIKHVGAPGANEVLITYSDGTSTPKGTPTLVFNGAVTGYQVDKHELPESFDEAFDAIFV